MRLITKPFPAMRIVLSMLALLGIVSSAAAYDFEVNGIYYNINGTEATVTRKTTSGNSYSGDVVIPSAVTYNGITYPVTAIDDYAFSRSSGMTSIDMPESITHIGNYAFGNCSKLRSVVLGSSTRAVGAKAFYGCDSLVTVVCKAIFPPTMGNENCFTSYDKATLFVPAISVDAYRNTDWWNRFSEIVGTSFSTGPDDLNGDGKCNIEDVTTLIQALLAGIDDEHADFMDVDGDGKTNIDDLTTLINILLRGY